MPMGPVGTGVMEFSGAADGEAMVGSFRLSSSLELRRGGPQRGVGHELSSARAKVPAREKPVARERSKKRRPRNECANDITLFVLSRNRFPLSFFWRIGERGSAG